MKNKKNLIKLLIVLLILGFIFMIFISIMNKPSEGVIKLPKITNTATPSIDMTPIPYSSKYVNFNYPAGLTKDLKNPPVNPVVDDYNFSYKDIQSWNLAITIFIVQSGLLTDNNAFQVRKINPTQYQQSIQSINGKSVVLMTDKTISYYNKVAFLTHDSYQATISLSGDDQGGSSNLSNTLNMILNSWNWK